MNIKKAISMILISVMLLSLMACSNPKTNNDGVPEKPDPSENAFEKMTWSAATSGADGSNFAAGLEKFAELLNERTDGAIKVEVYTSDQLTNGNTADSLQAVMEGTIDLAFQADGVWGNFDSNFSIPQLPFLFKNYEDVDGKLINGAGGEYMSNLLESKFKVKCLGIGENGFRYITNNKHEIRTPGDLKGLKLRVGGSPLLTSTYSAWGADYTVAAWAEVYTALQTGLYDGQENPIAVAHASSIQEVQKYVTAWTAQYSAMFLTINGELYDSLSDELKTIVDECGKEACAYQVELTRKQCDDYLQEWIDNYDIKVHEMSEEEIEEFKILSKPIYDEYNTKHGELIDKLS